MKAITLWPEWVAAVAYFGKDVENRGDGRTRHALQAVVGQRVAIHAGKTPGGPGSRDEVHANLWGFELTCFRAVGSAEVRRGPRPGTSEIRSHRDAYIWVHREHVVPIVCSAVYVSAVIGKPVTQHESVWAVPGAWHFPLLEVMVLPEPRIGIKGCLGVWDAPDIDWTEAKAAEVFGAEVFGG